MRASIGLLLALALRPAAAWARPYYSARKAVNCSACHYNPAGGGPRKKTESALTRINDYINLGADFRFMGAKSGGNHAANPSGFSTPELALYITARPHGDTHLVYDNNQGQTAEGYALWKPEDASLPFYARAGRFYLPYGLQVDDIDQDDPNLAKTFNAAGPGNAFSGSVAFNMKTGNNDQGVEVGLSPDKGYFLNLAATNGVPAGANSESKAYTGRVGVITPHAAVGVSGFVNNPGPASSYKQRRLGLFGWMRLGRAAVLGEWGVGRDRPNASPFAAIHKRAGYAELDYEVLPEQVLLKAKYEFLNPNTVSGANLLRRYTAAAEWFINPSSSLELQYRLRMETPKVNNDRGLIAAHVWF